MRAFVCAFGGGRIWYNINNWLTWELGSKESSMNIIMNIVGGLLWSNPFDQDGYHWSPSDERAMKHIQTFRDAFCKLEYDALIVATDIHLKATGYSAMEWDGTMHGRNKYYIFFDAILYAEQKIHILTSQLNEISTLKRKKYSLIKNCSATCVHHRLERLQNKGLLIVVDDVLTNNQNSAEFGIVEVVRRLMSDGRKPLVITEDADLRIRVAGLPALVMSVDEIYKEGGR